MTVVERVMLDRYFRDGRGIRKCGASVSSAIVTDREPEWVVVFGDAALGRTCLLLVVDIKLGPPYPNRL